ncbi:MAG TPA: hypothetical protein PKK23_18205 [Nitrospirales bacterium]|nr:hypothetical protein [Nitrospiraceae bacterium]HNP30983.1 hypothetical protein [Nitrospirales bacterium]
MLSEKPWDQFRERTEWTSGHEDAYEFVPSTNGMIVVSLNEENSSRAEGYKLSQREQLYKTWQQDIYPSLLDSFKQKLHKISERQDNWDGKGSKKPSDLILSKAHNTLENVLYSIANSGRLWIAPFVSTDEDGHITIQWTSGDHELHIEISKEGAEYIKIWGINIEHEMHLGILKQTELFNLWDWLSE